MAVFTPICFSCKIDSKGRITIPSEIRDRSGREPGDEIRVSVENCRIRREEASSFEEAKAFIDGFSAVESFPFDGEQVEVVLRG